MPRRPPHFKVFVSIQNHRHTLGVFDDDALLAMYVRAGILAIERYADRHGDSFLLLGRDLQRVAGCQGVANARRKLGRLEAGTRLTVCQEGAGYRLTFPNLAKKQFGRDGNGTETGPPSTSSSSSTTTKGKKEPAAVAAPRSGPSPPRGNGRPKRAPQTAFPEPFPPDLRADLQRWGEKNSFTAAQVDQAIQTVADWAVSNDKTKASWLRTIQGAMRAGWALNQKPGPGGGPPPKQENTRREYLVFGSNAWEKVHGYKQ